MMRPAECDLSRALFYAVRMRHDGITEIRIALAAVGRQREAKRRHEQVSGFRRRKV